VAVTLPSFSRFTPSVVALDLTLPMLRAAREFIARRPPAGGAPDPLCRRHVETLPFRAGTFGTVTCRIAAHHFPPAARAA